MKKISLAVVLLSSIGMVSAKPQVPMMPLDKINLTLSEQSWVETKTAKVTVVINAVLNAKALSEARGKILTNLNQMIKGNWHITTFNRTKDKSGLEKLMVLAEIRVNNQMLSSINDKAKKQSVPGMSYEVANIDFNPSFKELNEARAALRQKMYQKVQQEIDSVNQQFSSQHYTVKNITFNEPGLANYPENQGRKYQRMTTALYAKSNDASPLAISNQLQINAFVSLAANRKK